MIIEHTYNTWMPLNINDEDIHPQSTAPVSGRPGFTDATFARISHEVTRVIRQLSYTCSEGKVPGAGGVAKEALIAQLHQRLHEKYLSYCDAADIMQWSTIIVTRLIMSRLRLMIYYPFQRIERAKQLFGGDRDHLLLAAIEILEYSNLMETNEASRQWRWFSTTYVHWHALAVALAEICVRTDSPLLYRAWAVIDIVYEPWSQRIADSSRGSLWRPIKKLYAKAKHAREATWAASQTVGTSIYTPSYAEGMQLPSLPLGTNPVVASVPGLPIGTWNQDIQFSTTFQTTMPAQQDGALENSVFDMGTDDFMNTEATTNEVNWADWDEFLQDAEAAAVAMKNDGVGYNLTLFD